VFFCSVVGVAPWRTTATALMCLVCQPGRFGYWFPLGATPNPSGQKLALPSAAIPPPWQPSQAPDPNSRRLLPALVG
jgi:hypothetical protein